MNAPSPPVRVKNAAGRLESGRAFRDHVNPMLGDLLERLQLDRVFSRGEGSLLFDTDGVRYLDAVAGYGALPFGHNPDWLWQAVRAFEASCEPCMVQPSLLAGAGALAEALVRVAPASLRYVTFASSGTEAVEAAIKACRLATGRLEVVAADNAFHGKTLGALSVTGRSQYQAGTGAPAPGFCSVPYGDLDALEAVFERSAGKIAAFIVEPIQGEGGVCEPPFGYLKLVRRLCDRHRVLLIVDEIQTGLGRTGDLFACRAEGVEPDVMTLAKALGGGLVPLSACLLSERAYSADFARKHSSTFGGNALATRVGLATLEHFVENEAELLEAVQRRGQQLKRGLAQLMRQFPAVIRGVRGRGLMLGVEVAAPPEVIRRGHGSLLAMLERMEALGPVVVSYLLNVEHVRVAPTLNGGNVLRVQPPLTVSADECDEIVAAFTNLASVLAEGRSDRLIAHLSVPVGDESEQPAPPSGARKLSSARNDEGRFAFVAHLLDDKSFSDFDTSLRHLSPSALSSFAHRFEELGRPFSVAEVRVESSAGQVAIGDFIAIPKTAAQLKRLSPEAALAEVTQAVCLARERGARIVGLGGYTSVVVPHLRPLLRLGVPLTTGNSYTVVSAVDAAVAATRLTGRPLERTRAAVVGGGGSIGSALAIALAASVGELTLVSRDSGRAAMRARFAVVFARMVRHFAHGRRAGVEYSERTLAAGLSRLPCADELAQAGSCLHLEPDLQARVLDQAATLPLRWTTDLTSASAASELIFLVTSAPEPLLTSAMLRPGTVICDLSRPPNASDDLFERDDLLVIDGGLVRVPNAPDLGWHFGCPPGVIFACMAETMLLALEHRYEHTSLGRDLQEETLDELRGLASKHGFALAELRSRGRPLAGLRERQEDSGRTSPHGNRARVPATAMAMEPVPLHAK